MKVCHWVQIAEGVPGNAALNVTGGGPDLQTPLTQLGVPPEQTLPHAPQLVLSDRTFTQELEQFARP